MGKVKAGVVAVVFILALLTAVYFLSNKQKPITQEEFSTEEGAKEVFDEYVEGLVNDGVTESFPEAYDDTYIDNGEVVIYNYKLPNEKILRVTYDRGNNSISHMIIGLGD